MTKFQKRVKELDYKFSYLDTDLVYSWRGIKDLLDYENNLIKEIAFLLRLKLVRELSKFEYLDMKAKQYKLDELRNLKRVYLERVFTEQSGDENEKKD